MALFDVFARGKTVKVEKVKVAKEGHISGFTYITTLTNSTKASALKQATVQFKSGIIKMPVEVSKKENVEIKDLPTKEKYPIKKAIYCDFNGVIDDKERDEQVSELMNNDYRLPKIACPHKIYKLAKLAVDTNAEIIMTSMWRLYGHHFYSIIARCLIDCGIPEYEKYYNENEDLITDLTMTDSTSNLGKRTDEVRSHIMKGLYTHFVVFEDEHFIELDLNPIMTNSYIGLLDEHIEEAYKILKD